MLLVMYLIHIAVLDQIDMAVFCGIQSGQHT